MYGTPGRFDEPPATVTAYVPGYTGPLNVNGVVVPLHGTGTEKP